MHQIHRTIEIKAPVQRVYDFVTQPTNLPGVWPNLLSVSNVVAMGGGKVEYDWVYKMAGVHFKGHATVEEAKPARLWVVRTEGGIPSTFLWTYRGLNGSGTLLDLDIAYTIPTPLVGKIVESLLAKSNERDADTLLANIKDAMEQAAAGVAAGAAAH